MLILKKLRAKDRLVTRRSKKDSWTNYVSSLTTKTPFTEVWSKIRRISGKSTYTPIRILEHNNQILTENQAIANALAQTYESFSSHQSLDPQFITFKKDHEQNHPLLIENDDSALNFPITTTELDEVINSLKNTSPEPDNIPALFLINLPDNGKTLLLKIYNCIWTQKCFPKMWTKAIIIPIPKQNKNTSKPDAYRPVSLTCIICKVLEKIINKRLCGTWKQKIFLPKNKVAFENNVLLMITL